MRDIFVILFGPQLFFLSSLPPVFSLVSLLPFYVPAHALPLFLSPPFLLSPSGCFPVSFLVASEVFFPHPFSFAFLFCLNPSSLRLCGVSSDSVLSLPFLESPSFSAGVIFPSLFPDGLKHFLHLNAGSPSFVLYLISRFSLPTVPLSPRCAKPRLVSPLPENVLFSSSQVVYFFPC